MVQKLIRFVNNRGEIRLGNAVAGKDFEKLKGSSVPVLKGSPVKGHKATGERAVVSKVLSPIIQDDVVLRYHEY